MIERILPVQVASAEAFEDVPGTTLFPEERAVISRAAEVRQREFTTARACARAALAKLDRPPVAIPPGPRGAPKWPEGVIGSITHCTGYRAAAVALTRDVVALGVDAEPNEGLPNHGMLDMVARAEERARLSDLAAEMPSVRWDRLLFSAKESVLQGVVSTDQALARFRIGGHCHLRVCRHVYRAPAGAWPAGSRVAAHYPVRAVAGRSRTACDRRRAPRLTGHSHSREDLAQGARPVRPPLGLSRAAEGDLFESDAVLPRGTRDMQVLVDDSPCFVPQVPVGRAFGATPLSEFRVRQEPGRFTGQREVADQYGLHGWRQVRQPSLGSLDVGVAPGFPVSDRGRCAAPPHRSIRCRSCMRE